MALEAKAIKEEIPDKETYESNSRKTKAKEHNKSPDSPEGARAVAPRSPISPQIHHTNLSIPRSNRNGSISPIVNGNTETITPPPPPQLAGGTSSASHLSHSQDPQRALTKIRRFLGALVQFGQDACHDNGDKVRHLVLSLASGGISSDEFKVALQDATNFPVRQNVLPFLRTHIPFLQREIASLARNTNQTPHQYVRANENSVIELSPHSTTETTDIFLPIDGSSSTSVGPPPVNGTSHNFLKRRASEHFLDNPNGTPEWSDLLPAKRPYHSIMLGTSGTHAYPPHSQFLDYQNGPHSHSETPFSSVQEKAPSQRDEREVRPVSSEPYRRDTRSGEDEWKNIHTMLNCISAMVDKTKRAITILQQRSSEVTVSYPESTLADIKRQTEEKVAEFQRNAEEAVNQVKRQAVIEIQRAVATAENRAVEIMAQERLKMEKFFSDGNSQSPVIPGSQNVCWNCGRKANETCSGCNFARYCGSFCQHKDWEQHHQVCGTNRIEAPHKLPQIPKPPIRSSPPQQQQPSTGQPLQPQQTPVTNGVPCAIK